MAGQAAMAAAARPAARARQTAAAAAGTAHQHEAVGMCLVCDPNRRRVRVDSVDNHPWEPARKGGVLVTKAVEFQVKGTVLVKNTMQRQCLSHEGRGRPSQRRCQRRSGNASQRRCQRQMQWRHKAKAMSYRSTGCLSGWWLCRAARPAPVNGDASSIQCFILVHEKNPCESRERETHTRTHMTHDTPSFRMKPPCESRCRERER